MIYKIYPTKDATIYESTPSKNTGADELIELQKTFLATSSAGDPVTLTYASRALIHFNYADLNELSDLGFTTSSTDIQYVLKLFTAEERDLTADYAVEVNTISGSWIMGLGKYEFSPYLTEGVSWAYRFGKLDGTVWLTGSYFAGSTGSYNLYPGGGNWYTMVDLIVTKSFGYNQSVDAEIDISSIVLAHLTGSIPNDGIMVRRPTTEEVANSDESNIQYFSSDTNTIYLPHILVKFIDSTFSTGSLTQIAAENENVVYFKNLHQSYTVNDKVKLRVVGREKYPPRTFATQSGYETEYYLPVSSSYSVEDMHTKEVVIPHDYNYTRLSSDASGSFFNFWMSALQPERWYKFTIKTKFSNTDIRIFDSNFIFKVDRTV